MKSNPTDIIDTFLNWKPINKKNMTNIFFMTYCPETYNGSLFYFNFNSQADKGDIRVA